jgi:phytol kinase
VTGFSPLAGIAAVLAALGLALVALRRVQVRRGLSAEATRKGLHVTMSAVSLALPWLFDRAWPVVVLTALAVGAMLAVRLVPALRREVGGVLHEVGRQSLGDVCFPVAVCALYLVAGDSPVLYAIPILLLGLADPAAALTGARHGLAPYTTVEGTKSREGSVAFAAVAFLCVHVPLLLFTPVGRPESLWIAAIVAALATIVEAVSWQGLDNLFVPLGTYAVLVRLLTFDATLLAGHFAVLLGLLAVAAALRSETTVGGAGVFGAVLIAYLVWALGGTAWLLPPALVYLLYARVWPASREADGLPHDPARRPHTAHNVFSVASVGVLWLLAAGALDADLLYPYALAWGGYFAFLGAERMRAARPHWGPGALAWRAAWRSTAVAVGPVLLVVWLRVLSDWLTGGALAPERPLALTAAYLTLGLVATGVAALVLDLYRRPIDLESTAFEGRVYRAAIVAPLSALGLLSFLVR